MCGYRVKNGNLAGYKFGHQGRSQKKNKGVSKSHDHGHMVYKIVVSWTHCTIIAFTYCSMWYQQCGHMHAREHHIYICNGSLKTSVSDKLETTKKNTKHAQM